MRKWQLLTAILILGLMLFTTSVDARRNEPMKVYFNMDDYVAEGDILEIYATVDNDEASDRVDDVAIRVMIPELGVYAETGEFDVSSRNVKSKTIGVYMDDVEPGVYDVFVFFSNDDFSRVRHRTVTVW
jgi:hypothetical protein